jgi:hypothetical protein
MAKERVARSTKRLSRTDKIVKRLRGIEAKVKLKVSAITFNAALMTKVPTQINGFIVEMTDTDVIFRHKRTNASKRMVVSRFAMSDVLEVFGSVGEPSQITVMAEQVVSEAAGTLVERGSDSITLRTPEGETVVMRSAEGVRLVVSVDEESAVGVGGGSKKSSKKSSKKADKKPAKKVGKKSKKSSDDDDDL